MNEYGNNNNDRSGAYNGAQGGYNNYSNYSGGTQPGYNEQTGYNEYSYRPQQKKKSGHGANAVLWILCVCAIGLSSVVGYSLLSDKTPILGGSAASSTDHPSEPKKSDTAAQSGDDSEAMPSERITIEQLAAPEDAMSIPDIVKKLSPSVVGISCITNSSQVSGTGIIMSEDGYIVTNAHVVNGASAISVVLTDTTAVSEDDSSDDDSSKSVAEKILEGQSEETGEDTIEARLIGKDNQTDLAVLKIEKTGLVPAEFGTSGDIQVGELAIVIGNPLGFALANTVTSGIISATNRSLTIEDRTMNLIQTDASINSGNSGGPLINAYGQVIGITSAKVSSSYGEGLGFAIPIDDAKIIIEDLTQYSYVKGRPTLGISGQNISAFYADYYGVPQGFIVKTVESGSAAEQAGIKVNDIVVGIQGELIQTIEAFNEIKSEYKAGDEITVSVYRGENEGIVDIKVILGEAKNTDEETTGDPYSDYNDYNDYYGGYNNYDDFYNFYNGYMR